MPLALARTLLTRKAARLDVRRIVVAPFDNETGDSNLASLGDMAADWITQGLSRTGMVEVVDGRTALITSRIVEATPRFLRTPNRARALAEETGAGTLIWGTYYRDGDSLRFEARVTDAASGRVMQAIEPVTGPVSAPNQVIDRLRRRTVGALAVIADTANAGWSLQDEPPSYEAYREMARGFVSYFRSDTADALRRLRQAAALDPNYVTPLIIQAHMLDLYRKWDQVDTLLARAERSRRRFVPAEDAWLDLLHADLRGDQAASLRAAWELLRLSPGSAEYASLVALGAVYQNRPREALEALSRADPQRGVMLITPWYWIHLTDALHEQGSYEQELEAARRGVRQFPEALFMKYCELRSLAALGLVNELESQVRGAPAAPPDRPDLGHRLRLGVAKELRAHGFLAQASGLASELIAKLHSTGADTTVSGRDVLARSLYLVERWDDAATIVSGLARQDSGNVVYQGTLGAIAARRGNRSEAQRIARNLEKLKRPYLFGSNTYARARIAALLGERETAVELLRDALAQGLRGFSFLGDVDIHTDIDFESLRDYPPFQELVRPKG